MIAKYCGKFYDTIDVGDGRITLIAGHSVKGFKKGEGYYYRDMTEKDIEQTTFKAGEMPPEKPTKEEQEDFEKALKYAADCLHALGSDYLDQIFQH